MAALGPEIRARMESGADGDLFDMFGLLGNRH
jgi:hypothetical protein